MIEPIPCKIKPGFYEEGKTGQYYGSVVVGRSWAIVLWDEDEDPDLFKDEGLLILEKIWKPLK